MFGFFFIIDSLFFAANLLKVPDGGWVPLLIGLLLMALMTSWKRGRDLMLARWKQDSLPLASFLKRLPQSRTLRVPGIAVFLTGTPDYVPAALLHNLKHNKVLHERVLFVTVSNLDEPEAGADSRVEVDGVVARHSPGDPALRLHGEPEHSDARWRDWRRHGVDYDAMQASYFLGREVLVRALVPKLPLWRLYTVPGHGPQRGSGDRVLPDTQRSGRGTWRASGHLGAGAATAA